MGNNRCVDGVLKPEYVVLSLSEPIYFQTYNMKQKEQIINNSDSAYIRSYFRSKEIKCDKNLSIIRFQIQGWDFSFCTETKVYL